VSSELARPAAANPAAPPLAPAPARPRARLGPLSSRATGSMALTASVGSALEAIQANQLRAALTMLGIIIGVGAVIVMVALGAGATASVQQQLAGLGTNLLTIQPGAGNAGGVSQGGGSRQTLTEQDALAIASQVPGVAAVSPNLGLNGVQVIANNQNWNTTVEANYPSIFGMQDYQTAQGAAYDATDETNLALVADIGPTVATNLFGTANPVGQTILVRGVPFVVKGVLVSKGSNGFRNQDDVILVPFSTAQLRLQNQTYVNTIYVQMTSSASSSAVVAAITSLLDARHHLQAGQAADFRVFNNAQLAQTATQTSATLTYLLAGVAGVSLIVGGIGIMNIMLVSVTERTREIGIRMAIGARQANILSQFLVESILLSVGGGLIGIILGVGGAVLLSKLAGWATVVTLSAILLSFGFAAAVGVFFGYYPARLAARMNPIEALRYE
jgi:putative ABC transport system permease protein